MYMCVAWKRASPKCQYCVGRDVKPYTHTHTHSPFKFFIASDINIFVAHCRNTLLKFIAPKNNPKSNTFY